MSKSKHPQIQKKKLNLTYIYLGILFLSFVYYGNSLRNQYSLDDHYVIVNKQSVQKGIAGISKIFRSTYVDKENEKHSYRPITTASFAVEYQFFGANPFISHLINILLYAFCCILVFRLILYIDKSQNAYYIGAIAALIFLILPVHSEVVNNVKSRDELLCFSFGLLSLLYFLKYTDTQSKRNIIFGILFYFLSILSKTTSMTLIALIPFTLVYFGKIKIKKIAFFIPALVLTFVTFRICKRLFIKDQTINREFLFFENPLFDGSYSFWDRIPLGFTNVLDYLKLIVYPENLSSYYGFDQIPMVDWSNFSVWFAIIIIGGILAAIVYTWNRHKWIAFGLVWFLVSISMFTNIVRPVVGIIADRFAFLPSMGIAIAIASLLYSISQSQFYKTQKGIKIFVILTCALIIGLSWKQVVNRNPIWYDMKTLYQSDVENAPRSAKLHNLLASTLYQEIQKNPSELKREELVKDAISHFKSSVEIYPEYYNVWNNLGTLVLQEYNDPKQALSYFEKANASPNANKASLFGAGYCCEVLGNTAKAIVYYNQVLALDPNFQNVQSRINSLKTQKN